MDRSSKDARAADMSDDKGSILVVEDDERTREALIDVFREEGFDVLGAGDGRSALDLLRAGGTLPVVIFLDLEMPGMSGADFVAEQRADPALAGIPVVIVSADRRVCERAGELGASGCLRKPLKLQSLRDVASRYAARV